MARFPADLALGDHAPVLAIGPRSARGAPKSPLDLINVKRASRRALQMIDFCSGLGDRGPGLSRVGATERVGLAKDDSVISDMLQLKRNEEKKMQRSNQRLDS